MVGFSCHVLRGGRVVRGPQKEEQNDQQVCRCRRSPTAPSVGHKHPNNWNKASFLLQRCDEKPTSARCIAFFFPTSGLYPLQRVLRLWSKVIWDKLHLTHNPNKDSWYRKWMDTWHSISAPTSIERVWVFSGFFVFCPFKVPRDSTHPFLVIWEIAKREFAMMSHHSNTFIWFSHFVNPGWKCDAWLPVSNCRQQWSVFHFQRVSRGSSSRRHDTIRDFCSWHRWCAQTQIHSESSAFPHGPSGEHMSHSGFSHSLLDRAVWHTSS